jgi:hypothetical protein
MHDCFIAENNFSVNLELTLSHRHLYGAPPSPPHTQSCGGQQSMGGATIGAGGIYPPHFLIVRGTGGDKKIISLPEISQNSTPPTLETCTRVLRNMIPAMRAMFPHVESLVRLLLVNPASSATAERSFSSLRRLKTYLRSTCGQQRLNSLAVCHVHKDIMDTIDVKELMKEFIHVRDNRAAVFGHIV